MLLVAISADTKKRKQTILKTLGDQRALEHVAVDDSGMTLSDLEKYVFPSLFSETTPVISALFLLDAHTGDMDALLLGRLVQSPTIFILEEHQVSTLHLKALTKAGAQIILEEKKESVKKTSPLFGAVSVLCLSENKKEKWLVLQQTLQTESAEALVGMLYWKLRDLIKKDVRKSSQYKKMYERVIAAHARAWIENIPLALMLEKIILQK